MTTKHTVEEVEALRMAGENVSQRDMVLSDLAFWGDEGVCGTMWLAAYIPRYSVHIHTLRQDGYIIRTVKCKAEHHQHRTRQVRFILEARPGGSPAQMTIEEGIEHG